MEKLVPDEVQKMYAAAGSRVIILDYEGIFDTRRRLTDEEDFGKVLTQLTADINNSIVLLSDLTMAELNDRLKNSRITIVAESGGFLRNTEGHWQTFGDLHLHWKAPVATALHRLAHSYPNTSIDERHFSIRWDFGAGIDHLSESDRRQLKAAFRIMSSQFNVPMIETGRSIEFRSGEVSKSKILSSWMNLHGKCDFILAIGDKSDEEVFDLIGRKYITVRIGHEPSSRARYYLSSNADVLPLLKQMLYKHNS